MLISGRVTIRFPSEKKVCWPLASRNSPHMAHLAVHGQDGRCKSPGTQKLTASREPHTAQERNCGHNESSQEAPQTLRTPPDVTTAAQEQLHQTTLTGISSPRSSPTGSGTSPGSRARNTPSVGESPASSSVVEQVNEAVPAPVEQHRNPERLGRTPCSTPGSRQDSPCAQDEPTELPRRASQAELCRGNDERGGSSNWQAPFVEDMDNAEDGSTVEEPVSYPPTSNHSGRDVEAPVEPVVSALSSPIEEPQMQGPSGDGECTHAEKEMRPNEDCTAAGRSSHFMPPTNETRPDGAGVTKESPRKRKRRKSDVELEDHRAFLKRKCIESPVKERLDGDNRIYWPRSLASFEELLKDLRGSLPPVSENIAFKPAPQQFAGPTESFARMPSPGPVYTVPTSLQTDSISHGASAGQSNRCQTPNEGIQSEQHTGDIPDSRPYPVSDNVPSAQGMFDNGQDNKSVPCPPNSGYEPGAAAVPNETAHSKPAGIFADDTSVAAASFQKEPGSEFFQTSVPTAESASLDPPCPPAAARIPQTTSPLASNTSVPLEAQATHTSVMEPAAAFNPGFTSSEPTQMGGSEEATERLDPGQQNRAQPQPIESNGKPKKRRLARPCVPLETTDGYTSHQDAPEPKKDSSRGGERICHQSDDSIMDCVSDTNTHREDTHMEDVMEKFGQPQDTSPTYEEIPNKRFCEGLDSPQGLLLAPGYNTIDTQQRPIGVDMVGVSRAGTLGGVDVAAPRSASDFVFIVEVDGKNVTFVHRQTREKIRPWHERPFRIRKTSGNFFNGSMRIVEIDPNKSGAIPMDRFFQTEEVLVFQPSNHHTANTRDLVAKIERAVRETKKEARDKLLKQRYYLRPGRPGKRKI